ncbi:tetratricopeptide repeat protein [Rhizohabitans arisaemae]|uniref:tetratricopeptide repeat protein n=1 Tax=Rhizohabitans arisaemae TaxID=2720610 RepID=UPI0024B20B91|nr:tetratricopeptide repeat protein [Rhizohabitans arisaemae]
MRVAPLTDLPAHQIVADLAAAWNRRCTRLGATDRPEAAAAAAQRSVVLYERLDLTDPDTRAGLANALNSLSVQQSALGLNHAALRTAERALEIFEDLPEYPAGVALVLYNTTAYLGALGRGAEAAAAIERAVAIRRELFERDPLGIGPDLECSLSRMCGHLSKIGRYDDAADAAAQLIALLEERLGDEPDRALAEAYVALGLNLLKINRTMDASRVMNYADMLWSALGTHPGKHAHAVSRHAFCQAKLGNYAEAVRLARRAVQIHESAPDPDPLLLSVLLSGLGEYLRMRGRHLEALDAMARTLAIEERLFSEDPHLHRPSLAETLDTMSEIMTVLGRHDAAGRFRRRREDLLA